MKVLSRTSALFAVPIALILAWWLATLNSTNPFVPQPGRLVSDLIEVWIGPRMVEQVLPSLARLGIGLGLAIVIGVALGVLIGSSRVLAYLTGPLLEFLRAVPPPVLLPLLILIMGIGDGTKLFLITLGTLWPILLNTVDGVRSVDSVLAATTRTYGITGALRFRAFVLPAAMPRILTGVRLGLPIAIILMVVSEMYAATEGLGFTIVYFQRTFQNGPMWSGVVLLGLIGVLVAFLFRIVERRLLAWYYGQREIENQ